MRVTPKPTIAMQASEKSIFEASAKAFTAILMKKGLATARDLDNIKSTIDL